jgi:hypothetical protein
MSGSSYAVLFKTHFWDEFTQRQLERMQKVVGRGDIYVVVDETMQDAPEIPHERVLHIRLEDIDALRLAPFTTHGSVLWYNIDYPHYIAMSKLPHYDYYVAVEYDVVMQGSMDALIDRIEADGVDYLGYQIDGDVADWAWYPLHRGIYGDDMLAYLSCLCVHSRRGLEHLLRRRQTMGLAFESGELGFWPFSEAFLANETRLAGMRVASLTDYGDTGGYNWWPPTEERELDGLPQASTPAFLHPVLQGNRYVRSLLHHQSSMRQLVWPGHALREKLRSFDPVLVRAMRRQEIRRRFKDRVVRDLERLKLRRRWFSDAQHATRRSRQEASAHNAG